MENRSFDNAGPAPQAQGESSIILLLARKSHRVGSFSPNHFLEIYLGRLFGSTLHHRPQAFVFSAPGACPCTTCCVRHKAYQSPCYLLGLCWRAGWPQSANMSGSESAAHNFFRSHAHHAFVEQVQTCRPP